MCFVKEWRLALYARRLPLIRLDSISPSTLIKLRERQTNRRRGRPIEEAEECFDRELDLLPQTLTRDKKHNRETQREASVFQYLKEIMSATKTTELI